MAVPTAAELGKKLEAFRERGAGLAAEVRALLPGLAAEGRPLPAATLQGLAAYKQKYIALCEFAWPNRSAPVGAPTFEDFDARLAELAAPLPSPAPQEPLEVVRSLIAIPGSEALLATIQARLSAPPEEPRDKLEMASRDLLSLVSGNEDLSDERWEELLGSVTALFGREVAFGAARGKLQLPPPAPPPSPPPA